MRKNLFVFVFFILAALLLCIAAFSHTPGIDPSHHVPVNKQPLAGLFDQIRQPFTGEQLKTIGMPCGGIGAGQLYVRGDGTLACWWIANNAYNTGYGHQSTNNFQTPFGTWQDCYQTFTPHTFVDQGFTLNGRPLDKDHVSNIEFTGEYPIATIAYKDKKKPLPVDVHLQVFSPFIPLNARESATPGTFLQFTLSNNSRTRQQVDLKGHLQNMVGLDGIKTFKGTSRNMAFQTNGLTGVAMDLQDASITNLHPWNGNLSLSLVGPGYTNGSATAPFGQKLNAETGRKVTLNPGETRTLTFLVSWFFPNRPYPIDGTWGHQLPAKGFVLGNMYGNWFSSSRNVAEYLSSNLTRLQAQTLAFHDSYYNHSTLPYWLNRRLLAPLSILASETVQWWSNGKFYAWEGVGSCIGNCTHVWNYEQALAHFFPELERNMREQNDLSTALQADGGVLTRNDHPEFKVATDGQCGAVLKAYREHLQSKDVLFLARNWPRIKMAMNYLVRMDGDKDGVIEGIQPNTYDDQFYGPNTYIGALYLAALRACVEMGKAMHDPFGGECAQIADKGKMNLSKRLFNGEYYIQEVDLQAHPDNQYGKGCLSDQLFGQTWATLCDLGDVLPTNEVNSALQSIWRYNFAPDIAAQTKYHPAERDYAKPGEAGLLICTWPHDPHPSDDRNAPGAHGLRYRDEVWTGIEYQVATAMIAHGMTDEGLSLVKAVDDRYQPEKHNPWNEIECGDHYSRAMASWGVMMALQGWAYNGPQQSLAFAPMITPDQFESFFAAAEGWGNIRQTRNKGLQTNTVEIRYGQLDLQQLAVEQPARALHTKLVLNGKAVASNQSLENGKVVCRFEKLHLKPSDQLMLTIQYR